MATKISATRESAQKTFEASKTLIGLSAEIRTRALIAFADLIESNRDVLLKANLLDVKLAEQNSLDLSLLGRLKLDSSKLTSLISGVRAVARQADPIGAVRERTQLDEQLILDQVVTPIGVFAMVFESRPDVIPQILSLALRTGNGALLKGGSEAKNTNLAFMGLVKELSQRVRELPVGWANYFESRAEFEELLKFNDLISLVIPRGSNKLVQHVQASTQIPVLGHADGVCHIFVDRSANSEMAANIILDSKITSPTACNAVETVLLHEEIARQVLPQLTAQLRLQKVKLRGCDRVRAIDSTYDRVQESEWHTEYSDLILAVKIVRSIDQAIEHINRFGSHHTDAIISNESVATETFCAQVDSACVFVNASTRFSDGYRFGKGAEIGISTGKLHARGPVGVEGLLSYRYLLRGSGQVSATYSGENARPYLHKKMQI